jgi:two-component system, cell cycle response regulator DivK
MDISLPVMNGWDATKKLKSDAVTRQIPIIILTAHALETDRAKAFEVGCNDFDTKPVDFFRLQGKIENLVLEKKTK